MAEQPLIFVKSFKTVYKKQKDGNMRPYDMVEYGPIGSAKYLMNVEYIDMLRNVSPLEGKGASNPAVMMAHARWEAIRPKYEAWKAGQDAPINGTPLGTWPGITQEQADVLRMNGVRSVEDVAKLTDAHRNRIGLPGMGEMIDNAKRFIAAQDKNAVTKALEEKDAKIADLETQMRELRDLVRAPKKRGRPPKAHEGAAA